MNLYPVNLKLLDCDVLVVGGGLVALRKILSLLETGAKVTVISDRFCDKLLKIQSNNLKLFQKIYNPDEIDFNKYKIIIAATNCENVNSDIYEITNKLNIPVNVVDSPEKCSFYIPSVIRKDDLQITISTNGKCPALSKYLRKKLENILPDDIEHRLSEIFEYRKTLLKQDLPAKEKKERINNILKSLFD